MLKASFGLQCGVPKLEETLWCTGLWCDGLYTTVLIQITSSGLWFGQEVMISDLRTFAGGRNLMKTKRRLAASIEMKNFDSMR